MMKKFLAKTLCLFALFPTVLFAQKKWERHPCVYSFADDVCIEKVKTTSDATTVTFLWDTKESPQLFIPEPLYLVDSKGERHQVVETKHITLGKNDAKGKGKRTFSVSFEPLAPEDTLFDINGGMNFNRYFVFYGVQANKAKSSAAAMQYESYVPPLDSSAITRPLLPPEPANAPIPFRTRIEKSKDANIHIKGRIEPGGKPKAGTVVSIYCASTSKDYDPYEGIQTKLDENGMFELDVPFSENLWTYLLVDMNDEFPVFLVPKDTIMVEIRNYGKYNQTCELKSAKGNDLHTNLLRADPNGPVCAQTFNLAGIVSYETTMEQLERDKVAILQLHRYLAWKYKLTEYESNLLTLNMLERFEIIRIRAGETHGKSADYHLPEAILHNPDRFSCPQAENLRHYFSK